MYSKVLLALKILLAIDLCKCQLELENPNSIRTSTLDCHKRAYRQKVTQFDSNGLMCWDIITTTSCWGRCDSNEISDWQFPYKRSYHPVCMHGIREFQTTLLANCDSGTEPGTEIFKYLEAITCTCSICRSSQASCESLRIQVQSGSLGFQNV